MALFFTSSSSSTAIQKAIKIPALLFLSSTSAVLLLLMVLLVYRPSLSPPSPSSSSSSSSSSSLSSSCVCSPPPPSTARNAQISTTPDDVSWLRSQLLRNRLGEPPSTPEEWYTARKGIFPRTRAQQLEDLRKFKGISHYEEEDHPANHTALPCPGELLVEEHHSNYGEPWAGGRDVFEFLVSASSLKPSDLVLEIGCGTLRVGLHFIRYLDPARFHCLERDELSLMAALRYELPSQGLLYKRPMIVRGEDMDFNAFGSLQTYDLIYVSAVFLHLPDNLVWVALERLAPRLKPGKGTIFVSHNIKFCTRLPGNECEKRLKELKLEYVDKRTHDSLLFNHYEIWFEFRRMIAA